MAQLHPRDFKTGDLYAFLKASPLDSSNKAERQKEASITSDPRPYQNTQQNQVNNNNPFRQPPNAPNVFARQQESTTIAGRPNIFSNTFGSLPGKPPEGNQGPFATANQELRASQTNTSGNNNPMTNRVNNIFNRQGNTVSNQTSTNTGSKLQIWPNSGSKNIFTQAQTQPQIQTQTAPGNFWSQGSQSNNAPRNFWNPQQQGQGYTQQQQQGSTQQQGGIFSQPQTHTQQTQQTHTQQGGIFAQTQQPNNVFNQQPNRIFNQQTSNIFNQQQGGIFNQQANSMFNQQANNMFNQAPANMFNQTQPPQTLFQPQIPQAIATGTQNVVTNYLQHYQDKLKATQPFPISASQPPQPPPPKPLFNPSIKNQEYYNYLTNIVNNPQLRQEMTPQDILQFAQAWSNHLAQPTPPDHPQVSKLFRPPLHAKNLPQIELTADLLQALNDPSYSQIYLQQVHQRLQQTAAPLLTLLKSLPTQPDTPIKHLECYPQLKAVWKELKSIHNRVSQLNQQEEQLTQRQTLLENTVRQRCQIYKECFTEHNQHAAILEQTQQEVQHLTDYLDQHLRPLFNSTHSSSPLPFQDPDSAVLLFANHLLTQLTSLEHALSLPQSNSLEQVQAEAVLQQLCEYFTHLAEQLYSVRQKMRLCLDVTAREHYKEGKDLVKKVEQQASQTLKSKLAVYQQIQEIELTLKQLLPKDEVSKKQPLSLKWMKEGQEPVQGKELIHDW